MGITWTHRSEDCGAHVEKTLTAAPLFSRISLIRWPLFPMIWTTLGWLGSDDLIWTTFRWLGSDNNMVIMMIMRWMLESWSRRFHLSADRFFQWSDYHDDDNTWLWWWCFDDETHPTNNGLMNKQSELSLSPVLVLLVLQVQLVHVRNRCFQNLMRIYLFFLYLICLVIIWTDQSPWSVFVFVFLVSPWSAFLYLYFLCHLDLYL